MQLKNLIELYQPSCLVIDPISAMLKAGGESTALAVARRLLQITRSHGITLLVTSLLDNSNALAEATPIQISTLADTWIHLSYVIQGGERNRALTIIKSRGTGHSNQVRELLLSDQGITLQNVYTAGGEVLMGTLRWEKEAANEIERQQTRQEIERRQRELEIARAETAARIENLQRELAARQAELDSLLALQGEREEQWKNTDEEIRIRRGGASPSPATKDTLSSASESPESWPDEDKEIS
jgi:circadian clock protein KaiC